MKRAFWYFVLLYLTLGLSFPDISFSRERLAVLDLKAEHRIGKELAEAFSTKIREEIRKLGIYEILENSDEISTLMLKNSDSHKIREQAFNGGMITIVEDGFIKAKNGITTLEEVMRVTKE